MEEAPAVQQPNNYTTVNGLAQPKRMKRGPQLLPNGFDHAAQQVAACCHLLHNICFTVHHLLEMFNTGFEARRMFV